jgi:hypothetical protein
MKVNIIFDNPNCLNGYLNLDPLVKDSGSAKVKADVANLDSHIDNGEAEEIRSSNVLSFYDSNKVDDIINNWISKIRSGGIIQITEIDIEKCFKAFLRSEINMTQLNILIYGEQYQKWDFKKSGLNMHVMSEALKAKGLEIIEKTYHGFNFTIKARKNGY